MNYKVRGDFYVVETRPNYNECPIEGIGQLHENGVVNHTLTLI